MKLPSALYSSGAIELPTVRATLKGPAVLGYRKKSFKRAHEMLRALRADQKNLAVLKALQQLLCGEIVRAEQKIRRLKSELEGVVKSRGEGAAKRSSYLRNRIEGLRQCAFVWRSFGDAIAFMYMDKFALKQTYYNIENSNPKQDAGFLSDKYGLSYEMAFLESALSAQVPALLVDLTNTIRYGDVCLMGGFRPSVVRSEGI
jgi:hypothetical protein